MPPLTLVFMLITTAASLYALKGDKAFGETGLFHMRAVREGRQYYRLLTSAFLHADIGHLIVNLLTFFFFGPAVEQLYGTLGLGIILLVSQLGASMLTLYVRRAEPEYRALGASGAVSGVVIAYCVQEPFSLLYLFFAIPIPAIVFAFGYIAYSIYATGGPGRVAHEAHLGGALAGGLIALLLGA